MAAPGNPLQPNNRQRKAQSCDRADQYNRGTIENTADYDPNLNWNTVSGRQMPYAGAGLTINNWPGVVPAAFLPVPPAVQTVRNRRKTGLKYYRLSDRVRGQDPARRDAARDRIRTFAKYWNIHHGLTFVKLLGWGGLGLVGLFSRTSPAGIDYYVAKCNMTASPDLDLEDEARFIEQLHGCRHVIKIIPNPGTTTGAPTRTRFGLIMEYCPRGNLGKIILKLSERRHVRNALARMVAGMHYPPVHWGDSVLMPLGQGVDEEVPDPATQVTPVATTLMGMTVHPIHHTYRLYLMAGEEYVHFDLDPSNVLIGEMLGPVGAANGPYPPAEHTVLPVFKLSDFGTMVNSRAPRPIWGQNAAGTIFIPIQNEYSNDWELRDWGKRAWHAPEQFSTEWEYVAGGNPVGATVAGQWGFRMNIWGVGYIMWSLITKCYPPDGRRPYLWTPNAQPPAPAPPPRWTYAGYLLDDSVFGDVDRSLRELVAECMSDNPQDRPDDGSLLERINNRLAQPQNTWGARDFPDSRLNNFTQSLVCQPPEITAYDAQQLADDPRGLNLGRLPGGLGPGW
ncbi:kinase-like domain-containing protein [Echria macrotheca]|uniref:Kinase-like domain-containing protein n=1 Tax=Echria macrotheca TaxID=438768 RepID=A0AAJ0FEA8_9PEZI|nr:kinase-like domain-containing protein [Echria macrotheca]